MKRAYLPLLVALLAANAFAQVPNALSYQGRLVKADGTPEGGVVTMQFSFFAAPTGGSAIWSETQQVPVTQGYYATYIGAATDGGVGTAPNLFDGSDRYLEVSVNGQPLQPRHRIASAPYAVHAGTAHDLNGGSVNATSITVGGNQVIDSSGKWVGTSGAVTDVTATGPLVSSGGTNPQLSLSGCASGEILKWNGAAWACAADIAGTSGAVTQVTATNPLTSSGGATPVIAIASCPSAGQVLKWNGSAWACSTDSLGVTAVTAVGPLSSTGGNTPQITLNNCANGEILKFNGTSWACATDNAGTANAVTAVNATAPLSSTGGVTPTLAIASCPTSGNVLKWNGSAWACATDNDTNSGGTITQIATGAGLTGGPITTTGTISIANNQVTSTHIQDGTVAFVDWASNGCAANQIPKWNGSAWACAADTNAGGTVTNVATGSGLTGGPITSTGTISIANNSVTSTHIQDGTVTFSDWATSGCAANQIPKFNGTSWACAADTDTNSGGTVTSVATGSGLTGGPITSTGTISIANNSVTSTHIQDGTVTFADLASNGCAANQIPKWNGTAWACAADVDTDTNSGGTVTSVATGSGLTGGPITSTGTISIANNSVTSTHIQDGTIANVDVAPGALNETAMAPGIFVPVGAIMPYVGASSPTGWLMADGSAVSRTTYAGLFAVIGTTYGAGDGSTTFNLPDLRGRLPVGLGTAAAVSARGNNEGASLANRKPGHQHGKGTLSASGGSHSHGGSAVGNVSLAGYPCGTDGSVAAMGDLCNSPRYSQGISMSISNATHSHPNSEFSGVVGDTAGPLDSPAYLVVNYIIRY